MSQSVLWRGIALAGSLRWLFVLERAMYLVEIGSRIVQYYVSVITRTLQTVGKSDMRRNAGSRARHRRRGEPFGGCRGVQRGVRAARDKNKALAGSRIAACSPAPASITSNEAQCLLPTSFSFSRHCCLSVVELQSP